MKLEFKEVTDLEVDGVDSRDYPDFCDSFFSSGWHVKEGRELTDDELEYLTDTYPEYLNEMAYESLI